ncbi:MAG: EAL domain-containing protein [Gammaproteobacteria bacterium]
MFIMDHYGYNFFAIPTAVIALNAMFLGLWVLIHERRSAVSMTFFLIALSVSLWFSAFTLMYSANNPADALMWAKLAYIGVPFIPSAIYHFSVAVLRLYAQRKMLVWLGWGVSLFFSVTTLTTATLIGDVHEFWWGYYPQYGRLGIPFLLFFAGMMLLSLGDYGIEYRKAAGMHKLRIKWFMIAFSVLCLGSVDYLAKYGMAVYPLGYLPVFIFLLIASHTIRRYHFTDLTPEFVASQILETMQGAVMVIDLQGSIRVINRAACTLLGYPHAELLGLPITTLTETPLDVGMEASKLLSDGALGNLEMPWRKKNGLYVDVSISAAPVTDRDGFAAGIVYVAFDVMERKLAAESRVREERYALAVSGARDGLWDWNLKTNEIFFSARWKSMLGYEENEIGTSPDDWFRRIHIDELSRVREEIAAHLDGKTPHYESEHRMLHKDGTYLWVLCRGIAVRDDKGMASRIAGSQTDVTERRMSAMKLAHQALYDPLTGLPNRTLLIDILRRAIARMKRDETYAFAILFLDLDRFKVVNDSLGHMVGDQLLVKISRRLEDCLRPVDMVARFGGDEFALLLDAVVSDEQVTRFAARLQQQLMLPFNLDGQEIYTTASIGIALSSVDYDLPEEMLRDADTAMYGAKALGKARFEVFSRGMHTTAVGLWELEADLHRAIEREEFRIYYQPIVSLSSGRIIGCEALVRWQHPQRGLISPDEFIPLAEENGLIRTMGYWMLREACAQNKIWHAAGHKLRMAVNVSVSQFQDHKLPKLIESVLADTGMPAQTLELEITESIAMNSFEYGMITLNALKTMGIRISVDDFGTGYSSLAYLKRFPIDTLKIDKSFLKDVTGDNDNGALARAIISMAHSLKLNVIAEGVETKEQLAFLRAQGCDEVQGYLVSHPVPAGIFTELLKTGVCLPMAPFETIAISKLRPLEATEKKVTEIAGTDINLI